MPAGCPRSQKTAAVLPAAVLAVKSCCVAAVLQQRCCADCGLKSCCAAAVLQQRCCADCRLSSTHDLFHHFYQSPPSYLSCLLFLPPFLSPTQHAGAAVAVELGISSLAAHFAAPRQLPSNALHLPSNSL
ncbi:hypothetical protein ACJX0J_042432, partial [Zea mays]